MKPKIATIDKMTKTVESVETNFNSLEELTSSTKGLAETLSKIDKLGETSLALE